MLWRYVTGKLMEGGLQKPSRSGCRWSFPTTQRCALAMRRFTVRSTWTNAGIISSNTCPGRAQNGVNAAKGKHRAAPVSPTVWALNSARHRRRTLPFGNREGNTIVGAGQQGYLVTLVARTSRLLACRNVDTKHADLVDQTVIHALEEMPISWVKTITFDNGSEFAGHETMAGALPASIYLAAPYFSYRRGTNENTNGLIRR